MRQKKKTAPAAIAYFPVTPREHPSAARGNESVPGTNQTEFEVQTAVSKNRNLATNAEMKNLLSVI